MKTNFLNDGKRFSIKGSVHPKITKIKAQDVSCLHNSSLWIIINMVNHRCKDDSQLVQATNVGAIAMQLSPTSG